MALTRDFNRQEADLVQSEALSLTSVVNEVGDMVWIDVTATISTVQYTLIRYVMPLELVTQPGSGVSQQAIQTGGVSVYVFDGTETAYSAGTAPSNSEGTKIAELPAVPSTVFDADAYLLARGVARS